jgi:hypothetical protein
MICPNCGNSDPERIETVTKPMMVDGYHRGYRLLGYRCAICRHAVEPIGPPCGECHLQPGEVCDICGRVAEPAHASASGAP